MLRIEKELSVISILSVVMCVLACNLKSSPVGLHVLLIITLEIYLYFVRRIIAIMIHRRKIVNNSKVPIMIQIIDIYLINTILLSSISWILERVYIDTFNNMNSYFDSLYFTIVSFTSVGYGDIYPTNDCGKLVAIMVAISNMILMILFVNFFVLKAQKKNDYMVEMIARIDFLFMGISQRCAIIDVTYKNDNLTWQEWIDRYVDILRELIAKDDACMTMEDSVIKDRINFMIEDFLHDGEKIVETINNISHNKYILLENENITDGQLWALYDIKEGFEMVKRSYNANRCYALDVIVAFSKDLEDDLRKLGYDKYNKIKFNGHIAWNDKERYGAMLRMDLMSKKSKVWLAIKKWISAIYEV